MFARAGLATDVEVVDAFPARYDVAALRQHRWARGDWQLLPWIIGRGATQAGADRELAAIPAIGRWKMLDNLRRTLSAPACVLALLVGWAMPFQAAVVWTIFVLATIALPSFIPVAGAILPHRPGVTVASHLRALGGDLRLAFTLSGLNVILLAHQAWLMGDAILRTLWRLGWSRRHLLEWVTAAQATIDRPLDLVGFYRRMAGALEIGAAAVFVAWLAGHGIWLLVAPFAALWLASPAVARWISLSPRAAGSVVMSDDDARTLRLNARRTWRFFETFVTPADRMLPPDNFQEEPAPALARRTSPTNIGLYLLSLVSAHDFGWIGTERGNRTAGSDVCHPGRNGALPRPFLQLVRQPPICARSIPDTSPPLIAAIWLVTSSPSPMPAANGGLSVSTPSGGSPGSPTRSTLRVRRRQRCATGGRHRR